VNNTIKIATAVGGLCIIVGTAVGAIWSAAQQHGVELQRAQEQERRITALENRFDYEFGRDTHK
jgi:hypothetical protein